MGSLCRLATSSMSQMCCLGNTDPQGLDGLLMRIAAVFSSMRDSMWSTSICQERSGWKWRNNDLNLELHIWYDLNRVVKTNVCLRHNCSFWFYTVLAIVLEWLTLGIVNFSVKAYLNLLSSRNEGMGQVVEIFLQRRQGLTNLTQSWVLMAWQCNDLGQEQWRY